MTISKVTVSSESSTRTVACSPEHPNCFCCLACLTQQWSYYKLCTTYPFMRMMLPSANRCVLDVFILLIQHRYQSCSRRKHENLKGYEQWIIRRREHLKERIFYLHFEIHYQSAFDNEDGFLGVDNWYYDSENQKLSSSITGNDKKNETFLALSAPPPPACSAPSLSFASQSVIL